MGTRPDFHLPFCIRMRSTGHLMVIDRGMNAFRDIDMATHVTTEIFHFNDGGFGQNVHGWVWGDDDRWGTSGQLDSVYFAMFQSYDIPNQESGADRVNEQAWQISADGTLEHYIFGPHGGLDSNYYTDGVGLITQADAPHYPWLVAVVPAGGLLMAGSGEHGIVRIRNRRASDTWAFSFADSYTPYGSTTKDVAYRNARFMWQDGCPWPTDFWTAVVAESNFRPCTVMKRKFGPQAHNVLGFSTAWQTTGTETDMELANLFDLDAELVSSSSAMSLLRFFLAFHRGPEQLADEGVPPEAGLPLTTRLRLRFH
jgi:hypothetical protein